MKVKDINIHIEQEVVYEMKLTGPSEYIDGSWSCEVTGTFVPSGPDNREGAVSVNGWGTTAETALQDAWSHFRSGGLEL